MWLVGPRQPQTEGTELPDATYLSGSICLSGLSVHESQDCSHVATSMLLFPVEVSAKVAVSLLQPQTAITELTPCYLQVLPPE